MSGPEYEQTDIIPALRADAGDTAVDAFGPVGARHRRSSRTPAWAKPAAGVAVILAVSMVTMYGTYTLASGPAPRPDGPAPVVLSEEPTTSGPASPVVSPVARPSRTRADRRRSRTPSPSVSSSSAVPRRTVAPSPSPSPAPLVTRPASPSSSPTGSPAPPVEEPTSPTATPEVTP